MMKGVVVNKSGRLDGHWELVSCEDFERDYGVRPKQSEKIYQLQQMGRDYYIVNWPLVCGMFLDGVLYYVDYCPNIIINGSPKMSLIPDASVVETREEIYEEIRRMNESWKTNPIVTIEWANRQ